jgi:hypothetical protein
LLSEGGKQRKLEQAAPGFDTFEENLFYLTVFNNSSDFAFEFQI